eukprot:COSAG02_NODE_7708_length_2882_cov_1.418613_4_plen_64_part_00
MDLLKDTMERWEDPSLPRQYAAMQILIKHKGSKMTQSNRDPSGEARTRTQLGQRAFYSRLCFV